MFKRFFLGDPSAIRTRDTLIKSQIQKLCSKHYFYAFFREISDIISVLKVYIFYYIYLFLNIFYQSNLSHSVKNQSILLSKQINHLKFIFLNYITPFLYFQYYPKKSRAFRPTFLRYIFTIFLASQYNLPFGFCSISAIIPSLSVTKPRCASSHTISFGVVSSAGCESSVFDSAVSSE